MSQPTQVLPSWLTLSTTVVTLPDGSQSTSSTILRLPLTYYGPSVSSVTRLARGSPLMLVTDTAGHRWCLDLWRTDPSSIHHFYTNNLCDTYFYPRKLYDHLCSHDCPHRVLHVCLFDVGLKFVFELVI